jgi:large subunit ribosomal protein L6
MSRIGKKAVEVPSGVKIAVSGHDVTVEGGGKKLSMTTRPEVKVAVDPSGKQVSVSIDDSNMENSDIRAYWGTTRALLQNMILGVTKGYEKKLEVVGVGWSAIVKGKTLELKLGFASPVEVPIPDGLQVAVDKAFITIKGADKQAVGQFASAVRSKRKPEPYNGKGVKYFDETIRRKQGKVFGS